MPKSFRFLIALFSTVLLTLHLAFSSAPLRLNVKAADKLLSYTPLPSQDQPLDGYPFQYTSFAGTTFNLTAYDGFHVRFALPNSWTQPEALSNRQLRQLIELTDLTYIFLKEITAGELQGSGLLTIAVIPTGNLAGHAGSNFKGIELSESELGSTIQY